MHRITKRTFKDISIAAAIMAITGQMPIVSLSYGSSLAEFTFEDDDQIRQIVMELASSRLMVNAAHYEKARVHLYRKARMMKGGHA